MLKSQKDKTEQAAMTRIAIVKKDKCRPKKCGLECKLSCPVVRMGKQCIEVSHTDKICWIGEELCIGCGICVKKCPYRAINIINLPSNLSVNTVHRFGANAFKLHRLPFPRAGQILGLVGTNGIGKSTALKILGGKLKPNLGVFENPPGWTDIIAHFRGSELQNYFNKQVEERIRCVTKPQYVDQIPKVISGKVIDQLEKKQTSNLKLETVIELFDLQPVLQRPIESISGGELQRFACAIVCLQYADVYMFDEPSSYLDVKQRMKMAKAIRRLVEFDKYVVVVEHDLSVLDYLSDYISILYGSPGHYGVVTKPSSVRDGINMFLDGHIPSENLRFREEGLKFRITEALSEEEIKRLEQFKYPTMSKDFGDFQMKIDQGYFTDSEIIVLLGENGTGKTTMIRMLAGNMKPNDDVVVPTMNISYKPQKISPKFQGNVRELLYARIREASIHPQFNTDVIKPLKVDDLMDFQVQNLSGGELQRVAITLCLGKPADVYLIDEPSAYLDSEQRLSASRVIRRFILHAKKTAFVVEHDFIMATYMADRVIVFEGEPAVSTFAQAPQSLESGMNKFLRNIGVTFRRDKVNARPRINKENSAKDTEQKASGNYFFLE
ncbi:hypothetical protein SNEBB_007071 [Seison nebaliae]|nr:hypothetical protein SNEBB_007071 [Seison nebaliae]